jgi:glutamate:Na+ symporter, ESS family
MRTIELNLIYTLLLATLIYFVGQALVSRVALLKRFSIPAPVVGGVLVAVVLALADGLLDTRVAFTMTLKDPLLQVFFATVGLSADVRMLAKGGPRLLVFLGLGAVFIVVQNGIGLVAARLLDLHPILGLLGGSITLTGGHGTGAAYAGRFGETMNIQGATELTMASATAGLVIGAIIGGPLAEYLIRRHRLAGPSVEAAAHVEKAAAEAEAPPTVTALLGALLAILICLAGGQALVRLTAGARFILPDFVWCLLIGLVVRNVATFTGLYRLHAQSVDLLGGMALSLFLVMALMSMKLLDLVNLAGPLLAILAVQTLAILLYAGWVTFRVMGRNYDAAVMAAGHIGFGMSSTACALALMKAVTERHGPSPLAFLIVPMVGAFFIDITNAFIIQGYLALPAFGF